MLDRNAIGEAAIGSDSALAASTRFQVACLLKPMTAMILLQLQDEMAVDLEDAVSKYLPHAEINAEGHCIKVRHLLTHESGIVDHALYRVALERPVVDASSLLRQLRQYGPWVNQSDPGEFASYSTLGYLFLEAIIENVTGKLFEEVLEERIFRPLGIGRIGESPIHYFRPGVGRDISMTCQEIVRVVGALYRAMRSPSSSFCSMLDTSGKLPGYSYAYAAWSCGWAKFNTSVYGHNGNYGATRLSLRFMPTNETAIAVGCDATSSLPLLHSLSRRIFDVSTTPVCGSEAPPLEDPLSCCGSYVFPEATALEVVREGNAISGVYSPGAERVVFKRMSSNLYVGQRPARGTLGFYSFVRSRRGKMLLWDGTRLTPRFDTQ